MVVAEAADAADAAADAAPDVIDVYVDTTRHVDVGAVPDRLNPRGRIVFLAGQVTAELDLWRSGARSGCSAAC